MKFIKSLLLIFLTFSFIIVACQSNDADNDENATDTIVDEDPQTVEEVPADKDEEVDEDESSAEDEIVYIEVTRVVVETVVEPSEVDSSTETDVTLSDNIAPDPAFGTPAPIKNDAGGPVAITGEVAYSNPFFTLGVAAPVVILEDQAGFVDRDENYIFPIKSQTLGQITSDFYESPFSYSIALPIEPQGDFRDVDHDGQEEQGVQVFAIAYWNNTFGDPFLEERDLGGGGWSTAYASTVVSDDPDTEKEIVGGKFLVYAQDNTQGFPAAFGDDGLLFTADDPIVILPTGYTIVDMDSDPFTFDRSRNPVITLLEPEGAALVDYSDLNYTDAFNALVDQLQNEYAFTEYKGIDWEALRAEFEPRFIAADADNDVQEYLAALSAFAFSIPDGHVAGPFLADDFREDVLGGIGMAISELDDGRVLINFLLEDGPADQAGIAFGAEVSAIDGVAINDYISQTYSWFGPYSTAHSERLDKMLFATRFPLGTEVEVEFTNPGGVLETAVLVADFELESYFFWLEDDNRDGFELPVEYDFLADVGIGYAQIFSFSDNDLLTIQLWERMIRNMNENDVPAIIIDMRTNGGGSGYLADQMAAYFFDEPLITGNTGAYDEDRGEFYIDPEDADAFFLPPPDLRYDGQIVVLVGPSCASACEFFSYNLTLQNRGTIIGHYPTAGLGGSIDRVAMPAGEEFTFTQGRAVDPEGIIHIEGIGVIPDIVVPVTEASALGQTDAVLNSAIDFLLGN